MPAEHAYFRQLLSGRDFATTDPVAQQMVNFVYAIGDRETGECLLVDPAYGRSACNHERLGSRERRRIVHDARRKAELTGVSEANLSSTEEYRKSNAQRPTSNAQRPTQKAEKDVQSKQQKPGREIGCDHQLSVS